MTDLPPLPRRDPSGHKGTFGTVAVFGGVASGGARMIGAPALAAGAALRAGAGLARLVMPDPVLTAGLTITPSATGVPLPVNSSDEIIPADAVRTLAETRADALVIGPGLGLSEGARALALQSVVQDGTPVVVDADALTALASCPELQRDVRASAVFTPHPGEFRRLAAALGIEGDPADPPQREALAQKLAAFLGVIVVLKGAGTVIADATRTHTVDASLPQLATAGTGDVLSGVIAGISAAHAAEIGLFACAVHAAEAHAKAARAWADASGATGGMLASDLLGWLPAAVEARRA